MNDFFQDTLTNLVPTPNQREWWHHMPLPDGSRVHGKNEDKDHQLKMWEALQIPKAGGLDGKSVLDIGANDGFFTLAALKAGARKVSAINSDDWYHYPANLSFASEAWGLKPVIITGDFRSHPFRERFDVIFFFGVLYHLEDVFGGMALLADLLEDRGVLYLETQMTNIECDRPIFESASDIYPTVANQHKKDLHGVGLSNYLFPNEAAIRNLAYIYDFEVESLAGPHNRYSQEHPYRQFFKMVKKAS